MGGCVGGGRTGVGVGGAGVIGTGVGVGVALGLGVGDGLGTVIVWLTGQVPAQQALIWWLPPLVDFGIVT
ncbi:MAG: hypothetical protein ACREOV_14530, partial [Candidatus Dormibacteraceae bacterium]